MKTCTKCGAEKPLDDFHSDKSRKSGKHPWCKPCARARRNEWYAKNREPNLAYQAEWREENRERKREADNAYRAANLERKRASDAAYRATNRDAIREYLRAYYRDNPERYARASALRRARRKGVERVPYTRTEIYERDGGRCRDCQAPLENVPNGFHIDHIVPIKLGGPDIPANVQLMCGPCNRAKWANLEGQIHMPV